MTLRVESLNYSVRRIVCRDVAIRSVPARRMKTEVIVPPIAARRVVITISFVTGGLMKTSSIVITIADRVAMEAVIPFLRIRLDVLSIARRLVAIQSAMVERVKIHGVVVSIVRRFVAT